ncbi:MAG: SDR family NAD(P)-dependent oxidoreductase, partial [Candidatus Latescibacterota bacterium]
MKKRALILGAKSAIARAIAQRLVSDGYDLVLAARQVDALLPFATDIRLRHQCQVDLIEFDALDFDTLEHLPQRVERA